MRTLALIAFEARRLLALPLGWWLLAISLGLLGWDFLARIDAWLMAQEAGELTRGVTVTDRLLMPVVAQAAQLIIVLSAVLSLRGFCGDRQLGTHALLLASPLGRFPLVLARATGLWLLPLVVPAAVLGMAASLSIGTDLDWWRLGGATLGLVLLVLATGSLALAVSAAVRQPVLCVVLSLGLMTLLWLADLAPRSRGVLDSPLEWISLGASMRPFLAGVLTSAAIAYLLALAVAGVGLATNFLRPARPLSRALGSLIVLGLATLLALGGRQLDLRSDWTSAGRNSLSAASRQLLDLLERPLEITVFASRDGRLRQSIQRFLEPYERSKADLAVSFVDPAERPELIRRHDLRADGELLLRYADRSEQLRQLSETEMALALQRLARPTEHLVAYAWGSGERDLRGAAPSDLGRFGEALDERGIRSQPLDLLLNPVIPDNLDLLIITHPSQPLLPGVLDALAGYLAKGGDLLWLADPGGYEHLQGLAGMLGIGALEGVVVDARAANFGIGNPRFPVLVDYPSHPALRDFRLLSVFPQSQAWSPATGDWQVLLRTHESSWTETGPIEGRIAHDPDAGEISGPLTLALARERGEQRVVVVGDADFLGNQYVGIGGNLDLGLRIVNWLLAEEQLIDIPARTEPDTALALSHRMSGLLGLLWLVAVPLGCAALGLLHWWRRRA